MLIITFIHTLFIAAAARPATSDSPRLSNNSSPVRASSIPVAESTSFTETYFNSGTQGSTRNSTYPEIPIFNPWLPQKEIRDVAVKYAQAYKFLDGEGLSPLPNFTYLSSLLGNGNPTSQVAGSTYVLGLETYGADVSYYGQVGVGSPPQPAMFDIDTGSADLWVPTNCPTCNPVKKQFDATASSTYFDTEQPFSLAYGTGNVEGTLSQETVTMGALSVPHLYFGAVSKESDDFANVPFDGIMGMAFSSISVSRQPTFMESIIQQRQVNSALFGVHLTRHQPRGSQVCIGCYDPSKFTGVVSWHPVTSQTYWSISLNNIQVNGINTAPRVVTAAIDTGTSLIYLPKDLADAIYQHISGAQRAPQYGPGMYTYPCAARPIVSLVFGLQSYAIDLRDFNLGKTTSTGRDCVGGILAMGDDFPAGLAIIGDEFLKSWYSVYDYDNGARVGFARSINNM